MDRRRARHAADRACLRLNQLEPADDGSTVITSYCDWSGVNDDWKQSGFFPVISAATLRATLGILERGVIANRGT